MELPADCSDGDVPPLEVSFKGIRLNDFAIGMQLLHDEDVVDEAEPEREEPIPIHIGIGQEGVVDDVSGMGDDLTSQGTQEPLANAHIPPTPCLLLHQIEAVEHHPHHRTLAPVPGMGNPLTSSIL